MAVFIDFGLAYSALNSAKLSCSSEVTLKKIEAKYYPPTNMHSPMGLLETFWFSSFITSKKSFLCSPSEKLFL